MGTKVYTYKQRIDALRKEKIRQTAEKRMVLGDMDYDDWAIILPPEELRKETTAVNGSGLKIRDIVLNNIQIEENHPCGSFFGAGACGRNFRAVLEAHPVYIDPMSSLGGGYMINFSSYRSLVWNPDGANAVGIHHARIKAARPAIELFCGGGPWPSHGRHDERAGASGFRGVAQRLPVRKGPNGGGRLLAEPFHHLQQPERRRCGSHGRRDVRDRWSTDCQWPLG